LAACGLKAMVNVQMLSELEEVIKYKLLVERRVIIRKTWWERLQVCITIGRLAVNCGLIIRFVLVLKDNLGMNLLLEYDWLINCGPLI
jgi:hypothetical protein